MTQTQLDALKWAVDKPDLYLLAHEIAPIIKQDPQWLRIKGRKQETPFPAEPHGKSRVNFPKAPFLRYLEGLTGMPVEKMLEMEAKA